MTTRHLLRSAMPRAGALLAALAAATSIHAQPASTTAQPSTETRPAVYLSDFAALGQAVSAMAGPACQIDSLATSAGGREVFLLTLAADARTADRKPAMLIVAGLDGRHHVGIETALRIARNIVNEHAALLSDVTFYIIPCANPDGFEFNHGEVNAGHVGNLRPVDDDRDGAADEDGPTDINGDGVITMMRRASPPLDNRLHDWLDNWGPPTHVPDPAEPRLLKRADAGRGERAMFAVFVEGLDADRDGRIAEDGAGQVDLDRNFMHRYPEHETDAGIWPLSESESLALADFVISRRNIVAALTYGRHDNLVDVPDGRGTDSSGQGPRDLDGGDVAYYREIVKKYQEITGQSRATGADTAGSFHAWVYAQRGIPSFASTVWGRPDVKDDERKAAGEADVAGKRDVLSGRWTGSVELGDMGPVAFAFNLTRAADNKVTGDLTAAQQTGTLEGTFNLETSALRLAADYGGGEGGSIEAHVRGNAMTGKHHSPDGTVIEFTAKREGPADATPIAHDVQSQADAAPAPAGQAVAGGQARQQPPRGGGRRGRQQGGEPPEAREERGGDASKPDDAEAAAWLRYSDALRNHEGFIEWTPFDHPVLGKVEIGGFVPGFQMNPPADELDPIADKQTDFVIDLIGRRPRLNVAGPLITKLADGLYEIRLGIVNEGYLPTATAMARKARSISPSVVRISTPIDDIVTGDRATRTWGIGGSGDRATCRWIIRADNDSDITIDITNPHLGDQRIAFKASPTEAGPDERR